MFIILLKFSTNKANAGQFMDSHNSWLKDGFAKGTFLLTGTIQPKQGGAILAHGVTFAQIQAIVQEDPFVSEGVVTAEIIEITPSKAVPKMEFFVARLSGGAVYLTKDSNNAINADVQKRHCARRLWQTLKVQAILGVFIAHRQPNRAANTSSKFRFALRWGLGHSDKQGCNLQGGSAHHAFAVLSSFRA